MSYMILKMEVEARPVQTLSAMMKSLALILFSENTGIALNRGRREAEGEVVS